MARGVLYNLYKGKGTNAWNTDVYFINQEIPDTRCSGCYFDDNIIQGCSLKSFLDVSYHDPTKGHFLKISKEIYEEYDRLNKEYEAQLEARAWERKLKAELKRNRELKITELLRVSNNIISGLDKITYPKSMEGDFKSLTEILRELKNGTSNNKD